MGVWRCKVSLRYGIRNNVGLYRCRLCGGDVFLFLCRHFRPEGEHTISVEDLFAGYFETGLAKNELIAELQIPAQGKTRAAYLKVTTGSAEDWPALGVAVAIEGDSSGVKSIRVVVSAAAEKAVRLKAAEKTLSSATIGDKTLARAGDAAADEAECILDVRDRPPTSASFYASMSRAPYDRHSEQQRSDPLMATTTMQVSQVAGKVGSQVGRSLPRLEAREKVTGRAEYTHTMRLPGMLSRDTVWSMTASPVCLLKISSIGGILVISDPGAATH